MHLDRGFSLLDGSLTGPNSQVIWSYAFDMLKTSADDGQRKLFLNFGTDDGDVVCFVKFSRLCTRFSNNRCIYRARGFHLQELDMEGCPKPSVFVLHNCLSAKVHSLTM